MSDIQTIKKIGWADINTNKQSRQRINQAETTMQSAQLTADKARQTA